MMASFAGAAVMAAAVLAITPAEAEWMKRGEKRFWKMDERQCKYGRDCPR